MRLQYKSILTLSAAIVLLAGAASAGGQIVPPLAESRIGYLTAVKDVVIPPDMKKIFILPQSTLAILEDNPEDLVLIAERKENATLCRIPKFARYTNLMIISNAKDSIYFRGAVEAEAIPCKVFAGEELPVLKKLEKGSQVLLRMAGKNVNLFVPAGTENLVFSEKSAFAKFAEEQKKKGLEYFKGEWMSAGKAEEIRRFEKRDDERIQRKWQAINAAANSGFAVLSDGTVLKGERKGGDKTHIFFMTKDREYSLDTVNTADLSADEIVASGWIDIASGYYLKAVEARNMDCGDALWFLEKSLENAGKVDEKAPGQLKKAQELVSKANYLNDEMNKFLSSNGLTIYQYTVIPIKVLKYHLENEHVLLQKKYWVKNDEVCPACDGTAKIICPECEGSGKMRKTCSKCNDGKVTCTICGGTGIKDCPTCRGSGYFTKVCPTCRGKGSVVNYTSSGPVYPYYNNVYVGSSITIYSGFCGNWWPWGGGYTSVDLCPVCKGDGRVREDCFNCRGKGTLPCPKTQNCEFCKGFGYTIDLCDKCGGKKKISCPKCDGKGYDGEIQEYPGEGISESLKSSGQFRSSPKAVPVY